MRNNKGLWLGVLSTSALAAVTVQDLSVLQGETLVLKATLAKATVQKQLDDTGKGSGGDGTPVVKSVVGVGSMLIATFLYANGTAVDAKVGDPLPGGYRVEQITPHRVIVSKAGHRLVVGFSAEIPAREVPPSVATPPPFSMPLRSSP